MATSASNSTASPSGITALRAQLQNLCMDALHDADCCGCGCGCHDQSRQDKAEEAGAMADTILALVQQPQVLGALVAAVCDLQLVPKAPAVTQVYLELEHLGTAGPFALTGNRVAVPAITTHDIAMRLNSGQPEPLRPEDAKGKVLAAWRADANIVEVAALRIGAYLTPTSWLPGRRSLVVAYGMHAGYVVSACGEVLDWTTDSDAKAWALSKGFKFELPQDLGNRAVKVHSKELVRGTELYVVAGTGKSVAARVADGPHKDHMVCHGAGVHWWTSAQALKHWTESRGHKLVTKP